ncbi:flagellar assembly protein T N-terminal domain-containing protein [Vogesella fluminis]|uniref:Flagellar assembly protein T middle domain-containing protein n=1 Tax=Vogesella fluminis TaxID=1069161 RepID=A0ABQ3HDL1_9NEIS|nr:flagellar assembly protein T N-terminal domain-containing protein [Vogesella fluminis]GHD76773.1 hypothetical protein GCM10011419_16630 [Vogesella fluminis]
MKTKPFWYAALWAAFLLAGPATAEVYRAEGVASLESGRVAARQQAIEDAVRQMAMTHAGTLQASSRLDNGELAESGMTGPLTLPGTPRVLRENQRDGLLFVTVEVDTDEPVAAPGSMTPGGQVCARPATPAGRFLTRRLVSTYFEVSQPQDAGDLGNLATWLPSELSRRLNALRDVRALDAGNVSLFPGGKVQEPWQASDAVRDIGRREEVQFVLAGRVLDTGVSRKEPRLGVFGNSSGSEAGLYYTGPLAGLFGASARVVPVERRFAIEYWLYDALTGGVLASVTAATTARGTVHDSSLHVFDLGRFQQNDYGRSVATLLDGIAGKLASTMHCLPFAARVVRVDGDRIYLGAGALDGLASADRLIVYKQQPRTEIRRGDGVVLGLPERVIGDVELLQVQPRLAVALLRNARGKVEAGDWVRFPVR